MSRYQRIPQILILAASLLLSACGSLSKFELDATDKEARSFAAHGNLKAEVESLAQPLITRGESVGVIVGVALPDGSTHYFGYGAKQETGSPPPDADTLFAVGSLSKGFVAALTAILVDEGKLAWDDTLEKLLPEARNFSPDAKQITLLQLAMHNAGLPRQPFENEMLKNLLRYTWSGTNIYPHIDRDYVFGYLSDFSAPKHIEPQYSNIGYGLISLIIERKTGREFDSLLQEKVLKPLQLQHTGYQPANLPGYPERAYGHVGDQPKFMARGTRLADWEFNDFLRPTAGISSSAHDLLSFAQSHIACAPSPLQRILANNLQPRLQRQADAPGIQWVVDTFEGQSITHQVGMVAGYTGYIGMDAERNIAVVVLQNSFNWTDKIGHRLLHRLATYVDATPQAKSWRCQPKRLLTQASPKTP